MLELIVLGLFVATLFICVMCKLSIILPLLLGLLLFIGYGLYKKHSLKALLSAAFTGVKTIKNILITFVLIGIITAVWRCCGTIPYIVYHASKLCSPHIMVLITFLLCALISMLTGTSFGTAATMGVICVTMANSMGVPAVWSGGAVLAGAFFGDRCSPMSTSALLISTLTETDLFQNIRAMVKTAFIPFVLTCVIYIIAGLSFKVHSDSSGIQKIFDEYFVLRGVVVIPALVIVIMSLFKIDVKITMSVSIFCGILISLFVQKIPAAELIKTAVTGFAPEGEKLNAIISGGGIVSMVKVILIVCISTCYSGIFELTGLLTSIREHLEALSQKISPYGGILVTALLTAMVSCNQTLSIILTHRLCMNTRKDKTQMAIDLENTAEIVSPLIPWSISATVPLSSVGAPETAILAGCFLYLLPLWNLFPALTEHYRQKKLK